MCNSHLCYMTPYTAHDIIQPLRVTYSRPHDCNTYNSYLDAVHNEPIPQDHTDNQNCTEDSNDKLDDANNAQNIQSIQSMQNIQDNMNEINDIINEIETSLAISRLLVHTQNNDNNVNDTVIDITTDNNGDNVVIHANNPNVRNGFISEPSMSKRKVDFRERYNNGNWCDYCMCDMFVHKDGCQKYIDRCVNRYDNNKRRFLKGKDIQILQLLFNLEEYAREYLDIQCEELYDLCIYSYIKKPVDTNDLTCTSNKIIRQYIEREHASAVILTDSSNKIDEWLIYNNMRCEYCSYMACPFHLEFGGFTHININKRKMFCCGWCGDIINMIDEVDKYKKI